jgi:hypothetical protein
MRDKIHFVKSSSQCPVVEFTLGSGNTGYALVDTGSEITLVDEELAKNNKSSFHVDVTSDKVVMHGVAGNNEKPVIKARATIAFTENGYQMEAILTTLNRLHVTDKKGKEYIISVIIGSDFLTEYKAKINYINSQLSLEQ